MLHVADQFQCPGLVETLVSVIPDRVATEADAIDTINFFAGLPHLKGRSDCCDTIVEKAIVPHVTWPFWDDRERLKCWSLEVMRFYLRSDKACFYHENEAVMAVRRPPPSPSQSKRQSVCWVGLHGLAKVPKELIAHYRMPFLTPAMLVKVAIACAGHTELAAQARAAATWHTLGLVYVKSLSASREFVLPPSLLSPPCSYVRDKFMVGRLVPRTAYRPSIGPYTATISRAADATWRSGVETPQWFLGDRAISKTYIWGPYGQCLALPRFGHDGDEGSICIFFNMSKPHSQSINFIKSTFTIGTIGGSTYHDLAADGWERLIRIAKPARIDAAFTSDELTISLSFETLEGPLDS